MLRKLSTLFVCLVAAIATPYAQTPPDNEIWYTSDYGELTDFNMPGLLFNVYNNGNGVLKFSSSVTSIGENAFSGCYHLTGITIPNSVTSIGKKAFSGCTHLTNVTLGNGVTSIGDEAFWFCEKLTSINIPENVTSIGKGAFSSCSSLTSVTFDNCVTSIGYKAFDRCKSLESVTIPNSVTSIGDYAFYECDNIATVTIGNGVTSIGKEAFTSCYSLTSVTIGNSVTSIGEKAFDFCTRLESINIPESVTSIGENVFNGCSSLPEIDNVRYADSYLIHASSSLKSCSIKEGTRFIGERAFEYCDSLTNVTLPEGVKSIGQEAFRTCRSLESINIPESVTSFGQEAFDGCTSLPVIDNVRYADTYLIEVTDKTLTSCSIKEGTRVIAKNAFRECKSLSSVTIPESVTSIGENAFEHCWSLSSVTIPENLTKIEKYAFHDCRSLTSITIPNRVTSIGEYAFDDCYSLTSVTIGNGVTSIGWTEFYNCNNLKSASIGNGVTKIERGFGRNLTSVKVSNKYCYDFFKNKISDITFCGADASADGRCIIKDGKLEVLIANGITEYTIPESVTSIGDNVYKGRSLTSIKVPNKYCYEYFKDKVSDIALYGADASADGRCIIKDGKLEVLIANGITEYTIPESVTSIEENVGKACSELTSVKVPNKYCYEYFKDKVSDIAFWGADATADGRCLIKDGKLEVFLADGITEYTIPENVTSIGEKAFEGCTLLERITCLATTPPTFNFLDIAETTVIYVPKKAVKVYKKDLNWQKYKKNIKPIK